MQCHIPEENPGHSFFTKIIPPVPSPTKARLSQEYSHEVFFNRCLMEHASKKTWAGKELRKGKYQM